MNRVVSILKLERRVLVEFAHLFGLCGFAVAQPLYDLLGQNATFFVAHRASALDVFGLVLILSLGIPLVLVLVEVVGRLFDESIRSRLHWVFVFSLLVLVVLPPLGRAFSSSGDLALLLAVGVGLGSTILYARWRPARTFVTMLACSTLIFPVYFLAFTPVSRLVLPTGATAQTNVEIGNPVPVVLIVFDEFNTTALLDENGRIDSIRFPNFGALAARSWWFPNAVAPHNRTHLSIPIMLTGRQPKASSLNPTASDYPENLFTLLQEQYQFNVVEGVTQLCPLGSCTLIGDSSFGDGHPALFVDVAVVAAHTLLPSSLRHHRVPPLGARWGGFDVPAKNILVQLREREVQLETFLSGIQAAPLQQLNFLHVELPHMQYRYLSSGRVYMSRDDWGTDGLTSDQGKEIWTGESQLIDVAYQRYLQQVGYVDRFLGDVIKRLEAEGLYDRALIIVTADHGVSFRAGLDRRNMDGKNVTDILKVPMFLKLPGQTVGHVSSELVSGMDILPTITDVLRINHPWQMEGRSMIAETLPSRAEIEVFEYGRFSAKELKGFSRLDWQINLFGSRTPLETLVLKGRHSNLIGERIADLPQGAPLTAAKVRAEGLAYFENVRLTGTFLPALFRGSIVGIDDTALLPLDLAVAVNGRIWSTTATTSWNDSSAYFSTMIPEAAFRDGNNSVDIFRIVPLKGSPRLHLIRFGRPRGIELSRDASEAETLIYSDGREVPVTATWKEIRGNLESILIDGNDLIIRGWAADLVSNQPAQAVLIFSGQRLIADLMPRYPRPDVASSFKSDALLYSGFSAVIPADLNQSKAGDFRVFVVSPKKVALELKFHGIAKRQLEEALNRVILKSVVLTSDDSGQEMLIFADGRSVPVSAGWQDIQGNIDDILVGKDFKVRGWAADIVTSQPAQRVLVFAGQELIGHAVPQDFRADVAKALGTESVSLSGFDIDIPVRSMSTPDDIRVIVVSARAVALELKFQGKAKEQLRSASVNRSGG